jgi:hypothetical protein
MGQKITVDQEYIWRLQDKIDIATTALYFYADPKNWEYTESGGQFSEYRTIKNRGIIYLTSSRNLTTM